MYHGEQGPIGYLVTLAPRSNPQTTLLALNTYCRAFLVEPERLGVWCPEHDYLRVLVFDPDQLQPFPLEDVAGWFKQSTERVYSASAPLAELELSTALDAGRHKVDVPRELQALDELLLVTGYPAPSDDHPACAIVALYPKLGLIEVLPQRWFTAKTYDVGYQWITRVVRDPVTHRLVGDGIRLGRFQLTEDGCEVERWLE